MHQVDALDSAEPDFRPLWRTAPNPLLISRALDPIVDKLRSAPTTKGIPYDRTRWTTDESPLAALYRIDDARATVEIVELHLLDDDLN